MGKFLTREQILGANDIRSEIVSVGEWGGDVMVRGLTGAGRDAFEASIMKGKGKDRDINMANFRAKLVAVSLVDENGVLLFSERDVEALGKKSASALQRVFDVAQRLAGISEADVKELTESEEQAAE